MDAKFEFSKVFVGYWQDKPFPTDVKPNDKRLDKKPWQKAKVDAGGSASSRAD